MLNKFKIGGIFNNIEIDLTKDIIFVLCTEKFDKSI